MESARAGLPAPASAVLRKKVMHKQCTGTGLPMSAGTVMLKKVMHKQCTGTGLPMSAGTVMRQKVMHKQCTGAGLPMSAGAVMRKKVMHKQCTGGGPADVGERRHDGGAAPPSLFRCVPRDVGERRHDGGAAVSGQRSVRARLHRPIGFDVASAPRRSIQGVLLPKHQRNVRGS